MTTSRSDGERDRRAPAPSPSSAFLSDVCRLGARALPGCPGRRTGAALLLPLTLLALSASAQGLQLPSGLSATIYDVVLEAAGAAMAPDAFTEPDYVEDGEGSEDLGDEPLDMPLATEEPTAPPAGGSSTPPDSGLARFRLVVPDLGGKDAGYDRVAGDFLWLCGEVALPALAANGWTPTEVVVSLSDRETEFGMTDPEAVQFFEGFRIADGTCVPQAF